MPKRVGILTGGGDCPGLNAAIRAVVRRLLPENIETIGILKGWKGALGKETMPLGMDEVAGILPRGGTILRTSRTNPLKHDGGLEKTVKNLEGLGIEALVAIGGEDTLGVASKLFEAGVKVVGIPKTIDNDLSGTDMTFGFDTAVSIATEAIDRIHTTAESHDRVMVVEVMGRYTGWIAAYSGIAGGADAILIPEEPFSLEEVVGIIRKRHERGRDFSIVVVAEGAKFGDVAEKNVLVVQDARMDEFGHVKLGGIGNVLAREIEDQTGYETRVTVLGHIQRGGTPTAFDRVLATRFGVFAAELVLHGKFGHMAALRGMQIADVPLKEATGQVKKLDKKIFEVAKVFFG
jgi:6-phosphofructokinase 1